MNRLKDKVCIITGGTKGIGLATALLFLKEGAKVYVCSRNKNELTNEDIIYKSVDICNEEQVNKFVAGVLEKEKRIDILINNAGIMKDAITEKMSLSDFDNVLNTNVTGTF